MFTLAHPFVAITKEEVTSSCGGLLASSLAERAYLIHTLGFRSAFFNTGSNAHVACVWVLIWLQLQCLHVFTVLLWFLKHALWSFVVLCWPQGCTDIHTVLTDVCQSSVFSDGVMRSCKFKENKKTTQRKLPVWALRQTSASLLEADDGDELWASFLWAMLEDSPKLDTHHQQENTRD